MKKKQYKLAYTHFWVILIYNVRDIVKNLYIYSVLYFCYLTGHSCDC